MVLEDKISQGNNLEVFLILGAGIASKLSKQRAETALRYARYRSDVILIPTGGKGGLFGYLMGKTEAEQIRDYLIERGVKDEKIKLETRAMDTRENIQKSKDLIESLNPETVYIVTNKAHMPRALSHAKRILPNYNIVPYPTNPEWHDLGWQFNELGCWVYEKTKIPLENAINYLKLRGNSALKKIYSHI